MGNSTKKATQSSVTNKHTNKKHIISSKKVSPLLNAISFIKKEQAKLCVYGYVRTKEKTILRNKYIPDSIKTLLFKFCYDGYQLLKFSNEYQSGCFNLSNNNTIAIHNNNDTKHKYILCDIEPVIKGIHCWRVFIKCPNGTSTNSCVMWAISEIYKYCDRSFESGKQVWGGISTGYIIENGKFTFNDKWRYNVKDKYQIDMLLNCDNGNLKIGIVNDNTFKTMEINTLPKNYKYGFVPHFNNYLRNAQIRCVKIPHQFFRKLLKLPFLNEL
eukprot:359061_1